MQLVKMRYPPHTALRRVGRVIIMTAAAVNGVGNSLQSSCAIREVKFLRNVHVYAFMCCLICIKPLI